MKRLQTLLFVLALVLPLVGNSTVVRLQSALGVIDMQLYDSEAPLTVANFLTYVDSGAYNDSLIHRSMPGFVIQGGGFSLSNNTINAIAANAPVANEFSSQRSNVRGSVAMAKLGNDPNSATNQWFINLADNSANLNNQNGGFTVFARVIGKGMTVADALAGLPVVNAGGVFSNLPVLHSSTTGSVAAGDLVLMQKVTSNAKQTVGDADRVFAYLEAFYTDYLAPANPLSPADSGSASAQGYYFRYYSSTNAYIAAANGRLYYLGSASGNQIIDLGALADWLTQAVAAGY